MNLDKHLFALYTSALLHESSIKDEHLWLRIVKILRLRAGDNVQLFNNTHHCILTLSAETFAQKNIIYGAVSKLGVSTSPTPRITLLQAAPKRSVFEEIIYNAAQLGVETIVPIHTKKAHELSFSLKEQERFRNIMIAACEQAKQFTLPSITTPISFEQAMTIAADTKIIFDSNGASYKDLLVTCKKASSVAVLFGPEGGLIDQEITAAQTSGFISTQLTKTILRSEDAPLLGIGILRTFIA